MVYLCEVWRCKDRRLGEVQLTHFLSTGRHQEFEQIFQRTHNCLWFLFTQEVQFLFLYLQKQNPPDMSLVSVFYGLMSMLERRLICNHTKVALCCLSYRILVQQVGNQKSDMPLISSYTNCTIFPMQYISRPFLNTSTKELHLLWSPMINSTQLIMMVDNTQLCPSLSCLSTISIGLQNTKFCHLKTFIEGLKTDPIQEISWQMWGSTHYHPLSVFIPQRMHPHIHMCNGQNQLGLEGY